MGLHVGPAQPQSQWGCILAAVSVVMEVSLDKLGLAKTPLHGLHCTGVPRS